MINFNTLFFSFFFIISYTSYSQVNLRGKYVGKNLYVQNIAKSSDSIQVTGYCTNKVFVNDSLVMDTIETSAYEINLSDIPLNHSVRIKITHRQNCIPRVLNSNDILAGMDFKFTDIIIDERELKWFSEGEYDSSHYIIEHLWLKKDWIPLDTVNATGSSIKSGYRVPVYNHSGINKYRVSCFLSDSSLVSRAEKEHISRKAPIRFSPRRVDQFLTLTEKTYYQIYDKQGKNMLKSGVAKKIDCQDLKGGKNKYYLLVIDNRIAQFLKL